MGTFNSKNHIASLDNNEGDTAEVYKRGSGYYVVVSGTIDYDMEAEDMKELKTKLKRDGFTNPPFAGQLESVQTTKSMKSAKELIESDSPSEKIIRVITESRDAFPVDNRWARKPARWQEIPKLDLQQIDPQQEEDIKKLPNVPSNDPNIDLDPNMPVGTDLSDEFEGTTQFVMQHGNKYYLVDTSGYNYPRYMVELPKEIFK